MSSEPNPEPRRQDPDHVTHQADPELDEIDADVVEDLEVDDDAEAVHGGHRWTQSVCEDEGQPQIE